MVREVHSHAAGRRRLHHRLRVEMGHADLRCALKSAYASGHGSPALK
jgi:hypothetical protein